MILIYNKKNIDILEVIKKVDHFCSTKTASCLMSQWMILTFKDRLVEKGSRRIKMINIWLIGKVLKEFKYLILTMKVFSDEIFN